MNELFNASCPHCGGQINHIIEFRNYRCEFCSAVWSEEEYIELFSDVQQNAAIETDEVTDTDDAVEIDEEKEQQSFRQEYDNVCCSKCGAKIAVRKDEISYRCEYCGSHAVMRLQPEEGVMPDFLIPFRVTRERAAERVSQYLSGHKWLPNKFCGSRLKKNLKAIYIPYCMASAEITADYKGTAQKYETYKGDTKKAAYQIMRKGKMRLKKITATATTRVDQNKLSAIEPFGSKRLPFNMAALQGYSVSLNDISEEKHNDLIEAAVKRGVRNEFYERLTKDDFVSINADVNIITCNTESETVLVPVWLITYHWNKKEYMVLCNGVTGTVAGDYPVSFPKRLCVWLLIWILSMAAGGILAVLLMLL